MASDDINLVEQVKGVLPVANGGTGSFTQNFLDLTTTQTATGTKTLVVQDKGGQWYNVKAYGAKGDGSTNDTTNIQSAITAAAVNGGVVYFPPGTYIISNNIAVPSFISGTYPYCGLTVPGNVTLQGAGITKTTLQTSSFQTGTNQRFVMICNTATNQGDVAVTDMSISVPSFLAGTGGYWGDAFYTYGCDRVTLRNLHCTNGGFRIDGTTNSTYTGQIAAPAAPTVATGASGVLTGAYLYKITFVTAGGETQGGTTSSSVSPSSQKVSLTAIPTGGSTVTARNIYRTLAGGADGTQLFVATINDNTTTTYTDNTADSALSLGVPTVNNSQNLVTNGNDILVDNVTVDGQLGSSAFFKCKNVKIRWSTFRNYHDDPLLIAQAGNNIKVIDCTFDGNNGTVIGASTAAVYIDNDLSVSTDPYVLSDISITNSTIRRSPVGGGIAAVTAAKLRFVNNHIDGLPGVGILLNVNVEETVIANNRINATGYAGGWQGGIVVDSSASGRTAKNIVIANNIISNNYNYGIALTTTVANGLQGISVYGNELYDDASGVYSQSTGIYVSSSGSGATGTDIQIGPNDIHNTTTPITWSQTSSGTLSGYYQYATGTTSGGYTTNTSLQAITGGYNGMGDTFTNRGVTGPAVQIGMDSTNGYGNIVSLNENVAWEKLYYRASIHQWNVSTSLGMYLNASGYLGIGTTSPSTPLQVIGAMSATSMQSTRYTRRVVTVTQSATPTINTDNTDVASITALAQAITSFTTNLSGTPNDGDLLLVRITDNGTARAITWGGSFESSTVTLPTTTVASTLLAVGFMWNTVTSKWRCIAAA